MPTRYYVSLPKPEKARGNDAALAFSAVSADGFAQELEAALRTPALFEKWRTQQEDPDGVDPALGATDPAASVRGAQDHLHIDLEVTTSLSGELLRQRLRWLAGSHWELRDVRAA